MQAIPAERFPELFKETLSGATEDYCGLYEVVWRLNSLYPEQSQIDRNLAALYVITVLLERQWIELFESDDRITYRKVANSSHTDILLKSDHWNPKSKNGLRYWVAATPAGEAAEGQYWQEVRGS